MDSHTGSGEIPVSEFKALMQLNEIKLDEKDFRLMKDEDILVLRNEKPVVRYDKFMKVLFPETNPIEQEVQE